MEDEDQTFAVAVPFVDRQAALPPAPGHIGIEFATRRPGVHCPWPMWSAPARTGKVCGAPIDPDHPRADWCRHHQRIVYPAGMEVEE